MKIHKKEFQIVESKTCNPEIFLEEILQSFVSQILSLEIKVYICRRNEFQMEITADWKKYKLVLFNVLQNALKYNQFMGDVLLILTCHPSTTHIGESIFETEVIDTGIGISKHR